jgi:uncharacterized damage-inducible protein DinB
MQIRDALLPEFDQEMANTRKMLERVPDGKWGWKPHPKSFSMGDLAVHVMNLPGWMVDTIEKDDFDFAPVDGPKYVMPTAKSNKEMLEKFDGFVAAARKALAAADNDHLMKPWSLKAGGKALFTMPRVVCIRGFVMNHGVHHRGQLSVYLRLNDIAVPGMYGPSADEPQMPM